MEYVNGVTLRQKIKERAVHEPPLQYDDAIDYSVQICKALKAAHDKDIIHRDIKSENVMVNMDNIVKVMDFGLAKLKDEAGLTKTKTAGIIAYMAPEQLQGFERASERGIIFFFHIKTSVKDFLRNSCLP